MKHNRALPLLLIFTLCLTLAGCQSTSLVQKTAQARTAYTGVIEAVNQEIISGKITKADWEKYGEPARQVAKGALDAMDAAASGDPTQWQAAFDAWTKAYSDLTAAKATAESPPATTQPVPQVRVTTIRPIEAGLDIADVIALAGIAVSTISKMVSEGRTETTEEETAQLAAARAAQQQADDALDATLKQQDQQDNA